ncbi:hypothetical protein JL720_16126 [Aureococcus anophagefferens]|nr:hypothetical protein JL720_16126 [Aureococcus anophagefferens]
MACTACCFCFSGDPLGEDDFQGKRGGQYGKFANHREKFQISMGDAPIKNCFPCCLAALPCTFVCAAPASDASSAPCCCFHPARAAKDIPRTCMCIEACCCAGLAVSSTRFVMMEQYHFMADECDNRLIRFNNCIQVLSCICHVLAIFKPQFRDLAQIIDLIADIVFFSTAGCMTAQVHMRYKVLNHVAPGSGWDHYVCCQGYTGSCCCFHPGACCEKEMPRTCMFVEACCCAGLAVSSTRFVLMDQYKLVPDECDNRLIRFNNCMQVLSCICHFAAIFDRNLRDLAQIIDLIADIRRAARFMRIAVATAVDVGRPVAVAGAAGACGAVLLEPRDDWAALQRDGALRSTRVHTYGDGRHAGQLALAMDSVRVDRFTFQNDLDYTIKLHWFDIGMEEGVDANRSPYGEVAEVTVRGHGDGVVLDAAHLATEATACSAADAPHDPHAADAGPGLGASAPAAPLASALRFAVLEHVYDLAMEKRKALSDVQIAVTPNVIQFYNASHDRIRRPEADGGPLYNQRRIQTWHTPLEGRLKAYVFDELKRLMEDWAPTTVPLKGTSAYGVRTYERGAYLHLHVDTANTHVVSGIMNVAQAGSPRLLHGRPRPFRGDSYANIFVHYMPEHDWSVDCGGV